MKDIIIKAKRIKTELITLLVCFLVSFLTNVVAVIIYKSPFEEVFTSLFYVLVFSVFIYVTWGLIRFLGYLIFRLIKKK